MPVKDRDSKHLSGIKQEVPETRKHIVIDLKRPGYFWTSGQSRVDAYVLKERSIAELMQTLHTVKLGGTYEYLPRVMEVKEDLHPRIPWLSKKSVVLHGAA